MVDDKTRMHDDPAGQRRGRQRSGCLVELVGGVVATKPMAQVIGLDDLRRQLLKLDKDAFTPAFIDAGVKAANPIASAVRSAIPFVSGDMASTVRVAKIKTGASIRVGSTRYEYIGPLEFGGYPGDRPFIRAGRYVYPTATPMVAKAVDDYAAEVQKALDQYPWVQAK